MTFKQIFFLLKTRFLYANYYARNFSECKWRFIVCKSNISILVSEKGILLLQFAHSKPSVTHRKKNCNYKYIRFIFILILLEWNNVWKQWRRWFKCFGVQKSPLDLVFEKILAPLTPNDADFAQAVTTSLYSNSLIICQWRTVFFFKVSKTPKNIKKSFICKKGGA